MPEKYTQKVGECKKCKAPTAWVLHTYIFRNGSSNFVWVCSKCSTVHPGTDKFFFIKSELVRQYLTPEIIKALPIIEAPPYGRCAHCGAREAEEHHWAPKFMFGVEEANNWPTDYLCKECHDLWHRMVTPQVRK